MRLLLYSNAPWAATGYGTQIAQLARNLQADGHEVAIASNYGHHGSTIYWNEIPVFPQGWEVYSNDLSPSHANFWFRDKPGWVLTLYDVWPLLPQAWEGLNVAGWVPVDHSPPPAPVVEWCRHHPVVAMSKFGQAEMAKFGIPSTYIPHSLDLNVYKPTPALPNGITGRQVMKIPANAYVVTVVAANRGQYPSRKGFPELLAAMGTFMAAHDDVWLYMHTEPNPMSGEWVAGRVTQMGIDLSALMQEHGVPVERVRWVDQYAYRTAMISNADMAVLYSASDVLLAPSRGEGFGIPVVEAQACGVPVIVNDFSAQPELIGAGWKVDGQLEMDPIQKANYRAPNIASITQALEDAYAHRGDTELRQKALAKAAEYDDAKVYPTLWRPFFAALEQRLASQPKAGGNRAQRRLAKKAKRAA